MKFGIVFKTITQYEKLIVLLGDGGIHTGCDRFHAGPEAPIGMIMIDHGSIQYVKYVKSDRCSKIQFIINTTRELPNLILLDGDDIINLPNNIPGWIKYKEPQLIKCLQIVDCVFVKAGAYPECFIPIQLLAKGYYIENGVKYDVILAQASSGNIKDNSIWLGHWNDGIK